MIKTYQGYFQNGRFISEGLVEVPNNVEVYVIVTDRESVPSKTKAQQQLEAFDKFVSALNTIDNEPLTDDDFFDLENNRANFSREVSL